MFKNAAFSLTLLMLLLISVSSVKAHAPGVVLEAFAMAPPTIDGVMTSGEWDDAAKINFASSNPSPWNVSHTLYVMSDVDNLYLAVKRYDETPGDVGDWVTFTFDNDNDGLIEDGDDRIRLVIESSSPLPGKFEDWHYVGATPVGESSGDTDGSGAAGVDGNYTVFELSHPLDSGDDGDFSLFSGDIVGFNIDSYDNSQDLGSWPTSWPSIWDFGTASKFGDIIIASWTTPTIYSWWAVTTPTIDGAISPASEWTDAREVTLQWIDRTGSSVTPPTGVYAFFKNDAEYLYVLYDIDAVPYSGSGVLARMSFDTGHDTLWTKDEEHDFAILYDWFTNTTTTYHDVSNGTIKLDYPSAGDLWLDLYPHCSPFNTSLPQHTGLTAAIGFGGSPKDSRTHPIIEWRIPFTLLGANPGETIGFAMVGPNEVPGATDVIGSPHGVELFGIAGWFDAEWPRLHSGGSRPLDQYGDLVLASQGDEYFHNVVYTNIVNPGNLVRDDAVEVAMDVDTSYGGSLDVTVLGTLIFPNGTDAASNSTSWSITDANTEWQNLTLYVPPDSPVGNYSVELVLYDDTDLEDYRLETIHLVGSIATLKIEVRGNGNTDPAPGWYHFPKIGVSPVEAFPDPDWMLDHWLLDGANVGADNPFPVNLDGDHNLTAVFVEIPPEPYELTIDILGSGTTDPSTGNHLYPPGTVVNVTAFPADGWVLDHWVLDSVALYPDNPLPITMDINHMVTAVFVEAILPQATIESCNAIGQHQDEFDLGETVHVVGDGFAPSTDYKLYIVKDVVNWVDGMTIPPRVPDTEPVVTSNASGSILPSEVWINPQTIGQFDIVIDVNDNTQYDEEIDILDNSDVEVTAGFVIPEFSMLLVLPLFVFITLFVAALRKKTCTKKPANH